MQRTMGCFELHLLVMSHVAYFLWCSRVGAAVLVPLPDLHHGFNFWGRLGFSNISWTLGLWWMWHWMWCLMWRQIVLKFFILSRSQEVEEMDVFCGNFDEGNSCEVWAMLCHFQHIKTTCTAFGVLLYALQSVGTQGLYSGTFHQPFFEVSILAETSGAVSLPELGLGHFLIILCLHFGCDLLGSTRWQLKCCGTRTSKPSVWQSVLVAHACFCDDFFLWTFAVQQVILVWPALHWPRKLATEMSDIESRSCFCGPLRKDDHFVGWDVFFKALVRICPFWLWFGRSFALGRKFSDLLSWWAGNLCPLVQLARNWPCTAKQARPLPSWFQCGCLCGQFFSSVYLWWHALWLHLYNIWAVLNTLDDWQF